MKKFFVTTCMLTILGTSVWASNYGSININRYNLSSVVPNSYIRGVISQGDVTRWNPLTFPLKVYVQENGVPPTYVKQLKKAYMTWQNTTKEVSFVFVNSKEDADMKCVFVHDLPNLSDDTLGFHQFKFLGNKIADSVITFMLTDPYGNEFDADLFYTVALHEIGHSLGLAGHSSNSKDLMYPITSARTYDFTKRDLTTLKLLYKMVPDNTNEDFTFEQEKNLFTKEEVVGDESRLKKDAVTAAKINSGITPKDPSVKARLVKAYKEDGNYSAAIKELKSLIPLVSDSDIKSELYAEMAECYILLRNYTAAGNCIKYASSKYPSDRIQVLNARLQYVQGQKNSAVKNLLYLYKQNNNPYAGQMLKEIMEKEKNNESIMNLIYKELG